MKFLFKKIKKKKIILLYPLNLKLKKNFFYFSNEEINLRYSIKTIYRFFREVFNLNFSLRDSYFKTIVEEVDPRIAIGSDPDHRIYKFKKFYPKKIGISFQFGLIHKVFEKEHNYFWGGKKIDYFIVFDNLSKKFLSKLKTLKTVFKIYGSLRNNQIKIIQKKKQFDLMYISDFRVASKNSFEKKTQDKNKKMLKFLAKYCIENKKKIVIALVANRKDKVRYLKLKGLREKELEYYNSISNVFCFNEQNAYQLAGKCKLAICAASTYGAELLARGYKVLFVNNYFLKNQKIKDSLTFCKIIKYDNISKKISYLLNLKKKKWLKKIKTIDKIFYDKNNINFENFLKKIN